MPGPLLPFPSLLSIYTAVDGFITAPPRYTDIPCNLVPSLQRPTLEQLGSFVTGWTHYVVVDSATDIRDDQQPFEQLYPGPDADFVEVQSQPGVFYRVMFVMDSYLDQDEAYRKVYLWRLTPAYVAPPPELLAGRPDTAAREARLARFCTVPAQRVSDAERRRRSLAARSGSQVSRPSHKGV